MKSRTRLVLAGTHLLALGAGWWSVQSAPLPSDAPPVEALASKTSPRPERRVSAAGLRSAYDHPDLWGESLKRRNEASRRRETSSDTPAAHAPPAQRAAEIADIAGALQKELEAVNAGKTYDYQLTKALVARWMKEDPAACAAWLGQMKMQGGWGDPFVAFAQALPPGELQALMDQGWLRVNRRLALGSLADHLAEKSPAELPAVLSRLPEDETKAFLKNAADRAKAEDAAVWLGLLADDPQALRSLADRWIEGPGANWTWRDGEWTAARADWQDAAQRVAAAAAGTPAEEIFQQRWDAEQQRSEKGRELARVAREPAAATAALVELFRQQGHDEPEARRLATEEISQSYRNGLDVWQREAWDQDLQLSLLGQRKLGDVLAGRLEAIEAELPEMLQAGTRTPVWRDALQIDPAATFEVARQQGRLDEALQGAVAVVNDPETSRALKAEVLLALAKQGLWEQGGRLPGAGPFIADYLKDDPEGARSWMNRLPSPLSPPAKEGGR